MKADETSVVESTKELSQEDKLSKLTKNERAFYEEVDETLFTLWDPLGVNSNPASREEYRFYTWEVCRLIESDGNISSYLLNVVENEPGVEIGEKEIENTRKTEMILKKEYALLVM